jgi:hypothetical protein
MLTFKFNLQVLTLYISLFKEYYIHKATVNTSDTCFILLKNKKEISSDYILNIKKISNNILFPNYDVEYYDTFNYMSRLNDNDKKLFSGSNISFFKKIKFKDNNLKKIFNKLVLDIIKTNYDHYSDTSALLYKKILILDTDSIDQYITNDIKRKNLLDAIQFAEKNNLPLKSEYDLEAFKIKYLQFIFDDITSFKKSMLFKIKLKIDLLKDDINSKISNNVDFKDIPEYYNNVIKKEKLEIMILEKDKIQKIYDDDYDRIHHKIHIYNHKRYEIIAKIYNVDKIYITNDWINITKILHKFSFLINPINKNNTFHIFEPYLEPTVHAIEKYINNYV